MTKTVSVPVELLERVLYIFDNYVTFVNAEEDELRALLAQPDAQVTEDVRRDAERYRFLKSKCDTGFVVELEEHVFQSRWDSYIDAALAQHAGQT